MENECISHNFVILAIFVPKIIKVGGILTKYIINKYKYKHTYSFMQQNDRSKTHIRDFLCLDVGIDAAGWYSASTALVYRILTHCPQTIRTSY